MQTIYTNVRNFLSLLLESGYKSVYSEAMLSFWPWQVKIWGVPSKLALWSSEGQNRQLAGIHLDLDTAGETWAQQVIHFSHVLSFILCAIQYSRTEVLRYWNDTYEENMGVSAAPRPQGLHLDKGDRILYLNYFEAQIPGMSYAADLTWFFDTNPDIFFLFFLLQA
jgi:hypothetical protein